MESAHKEPFAELKMVAARLDVEIANAANCLNGPVNTLPTTAIKAFEQATALEAQFNLLELRLEAVLKEKQASIQEMEDFLEKAHRDNKELLLKLLPLGFKVPDNVSRALKDMPLPCDQDSDETSLTTSRASPCSLQNCVTKLEPMFSSIALDSSHPRPSQTSSHLSKQPEQPRHSKPAIQSPARPHSHFKSKLDRYLEEIGDDDTMLFLKRKPLPVEAFEAAENTAGPSHTPVKADMQDPVQTFGMRGLMQSSANETYMSGAKPLPKTPEPPRTPEPPGNAFEEEENKTIWTRTVPMFKEHGPAALPKTPELERTPPVLKESNLGLPW